MSNACRLSNPVMLKIEEVAFFSFFFSFFNLTSYGNYLLPDDSREAVLNEISEEYIYILKTI